MRIACLIAFHDQPAQLARLLEATPQPLFSHYLHCDARVDAAPFRAAVPADLPVTWVPRVPVHWAGFSQVRASLSLLRSAARDPANTHVALLSGRCLPIRPPAEIAQLVADRPGDWMTSAPLPIDTATQFKSLDRLNRRYAMDAPSRRTRKAAHAVLRLLPERSVGRLLHGLTPHGGDSWWLLGRETVDQMLGWLAANPWYERAFRQTYCGDEVFFQTLLGALGRPPANRCPTGAVWAPRAPHPEPLTEERVEALRRDGYLFARKFPLAEA